MKKLTLSIALFTFLAFGAANIQTAVAANKTTAITLLQDVKKKDVKKKDKKSSACTDKKSCCKSEGKKEACCNDEKKADKK